MTTEPTWTGTPDNQTARIGDYVLRVKDIQGYCYWWKVLIDNELVSKGVEFLNSKAKTACEKAYREHLKTNL